MNVTAKTNNTQNSCGIRSFSHKQATLKLILLDIHNVGENSGKRWKIIVKGRSKEKLKVQTPQEQMQEAHTSHAHILKNKKVVVGSQPTQGPQKPISYTEFSQ